MNFREAIRRLAIVVAGVGVIATIIGGASLAPSKSSLATTFLFSVAAEDADEMKTTASEILRAYRANFSSDEEILRHICAKNPKHRDTCEIYTMETEQHWKKVLMHWAGTIGIALGVGIAIMLLWKILDWVIAGLGVSRA